MVLAPAMTLTIPQRTVLNVAGCASGIGDAATMGASPGWLCAHPDVDFDDIYSLIEGGYLIGPHRWAMTYGLEPNEPDPETYAKHQRCCVEEYRKVGEDMFRFHLTGRGRRWVEADPFNIVLRGVWFAPSRTLRLDRALALADGERDLIRKAWSKGWFSLHFAGDGHETTWSSGSGDYEFRHGQDFVVKATHKIRSVLG